MHMKSMVPLLALAAACYNESPVEAPVFHSPVPASVKAEDEQITAALTALGNSLAETAVAAGAQVELQSAEWLSADGLGTIILFEDRGNKKLNDLVGDWVPADPRRQGRTNITYWIDEAQGSVGTLTPAQTSAAIDRAMATWNGVKCSVIPITKLAEPAGFPPADISHMGWSTLDAGVLGVTYTFVFVDATGAKTDIDNNGAADVAWRPIFYGKRDGWGTLYDVETVALHEAGHGLSQAHFGKAFLTESGDGLKIHVAPRAVMNAQYTGEQRTIGETDNAGHCANWASWPHN